MSEKVHRKQSLLQTCAESFAEYSHGACFCSFKTLLGTEMATGAQRDEPSSRFCEIVQIGRLQGGQYGPHEITIFFKNTARGEFEVQGGIIVDEKGSRNRRTLKIVTTKGQNLGIARDPGGKYTFADLYSARTFWMIQLGRLVF